MRSCKQDTISFILLILILSLGIFGCKSNNQEVDGQLPLAGINTAWQDFSPFSTSLPFTNVIKTSGGWLQSDFQTDSNGYPLNLENGHIAELEIFRFSDGHFPTGEYLLTWEGKGSIKLSTGNRTYNFSRDDESSQIILIDSINKNGFTLSIEQTDETNPIRDLKLNLPGYHNSLQIWTKEYINSLKPYDVIRFMWGSGVWCITDTIVDWNQRRKLSYFHWPAGDHSIGIPYEAMIELCNRSGNDLWICVPHLASIDYLTEAAALFRDHLNPGLKCWIEYSNEHWLDIDFFTIPPNNYLKEEVNNYNAKNTDENLTVSELYGIKSVHLFEVFNHVFAEKNQTKRLVNVICGNTADHKPLLEAANQIQQLGKMDLVDAFGVGPYFRPYLGINDHFTPALDKGWDSIFYSVTKTVDDMFDTNGYVGKELYANALLAKKYDKALVAYEGGQHYTVWGGIRADIIAPLNRRPEMYDVYMKFLDGWGNLPNASTFTFFAAYSYFNREEAFGLSEYYNQPMLETPKRKAVLDWIDKNKNN